MGIALDLEVGMVEALSVEVKRESPVVSPTSVATEDASDSVIVVLANEPSVDNKCYSSSFFVSSGWRRADCR